MQPPAPSLRRRSRKPQHVALADKSEDSSGGSVPPPPAANTRQSAGSLMWYMLEQVGRLVEGWHEAGSCMLEPLFSTLTPPGCLPAATPSTGEVCRR